MSDCKLSFICSRNWADLEEGVDIGRRHCHTCKTDVFAVYDENEFEQHKTQGKCVALFLSGVSITLGVPHFDVGAGTNFDPILSQGLTEIDGLPLKMLEILHNRDINRIGDLVCLTEVEVLKLLRPSRVNMIRLKEVLAERGLTLGMRLQSWK